MKLTKITIKNFKSIDEMEFEIKKYGSSYTSMFVGINEVGKSNILEAMSFMEVPKEVFEFKNLNNRNNKDVESVDLYFEMGFENENSYLDVLKEKITSSDSFFKQLVVSKITKNVYLKKGETTFKQEYDYELEGIKASEYYNRKTVPAGIEIKHKSEIDDQDKDLFEQLDNDKLVTIIKPFLDEVTTKYELGVTFWKPEKEFLITQPVNLNAFKDNTAVNIPLKNIFALSGYKKAEEIKSKIEEIKGDHSLRRGLQSELTSSATKYFGGVWEHKIEIDVEITEGLLCNVTVKDKGKSNKDKFFNMNVRSQGFQQFVSLILSLSIQNSSLDMKDKLILIDEPENHLHPSGIRNMMQELLNIGTNNYVFLATHSCFMIDKKNKERNFIIKKDQKQNTVYSQISEEADMFDDEVLADAFGINVYRDLMTPHKILVEGKSDKVILHKTISKLGIPLEIGITNGYGSNIVAIASRFNLEKINSLVVLDDDDSGTENQKKIIKIGGLYSKTNVLTIRDIESKIITKGTIEDTLGQGFMQSKLELFWKEIFGSDLTGLTLSDKEPFIEQIKIHLKKEKPQENVDKFLEGLKTKISEDFNPSDMDKNFPLLKSLVKTIEEKLKGADKP